MQVNACLHTRMSRFRPEVRAGKDVMALVSGPGRSFKRSTLNSIEILNHEIKRERVFLH